MELTQEIKQAILDGAFAMTRDGQKAKYVGESTLNALSLTFIVLPTKPFNYYKPFEGINIIFVDDKHFKAIPSTMEDHRHDIVGLWVESTPTVTLDLPKPFKPKKQELFFTLISTAPYKPLEVRQTYNAGCDVDTNLIEAGLCFKTEQDAQAWADAFKKALNEETEIIQR